MPPKPISNRKTFGLSPYVIAGGLVVLAIGFVIGWWLPDFSAAIFYAGAAATLGGMAWLLIGAIRYARRLRHIESRRKDRSQGDQGETSTPEPDPNAEMHAEQAETTLDQTDEKPRQGTQATRGQTAHRATAYAS